MEEETKSLDEFKTEIEILCSQIESMPVKDKIEAIKHLEETVALLKFGSNQPDYDIKMEDPEELDFESVT